MYRPNAGSYGDIGYELVMGPQILHLYHLWREEALDLNWSTRLSVVSDIGRIRMLIPPLE